MIRNIEFDEFLNVKTQPGLRIFIFLLLDEFGYINSEYNWLNYLSEDVFLVRLNIEEFSILDIGVHPKVIIINNDKEIAQFNGIPYMENLQDTLKDII